MSLDGFAFQACSFNHFAAVGWTAELPSQEPTSIESCEGAEPNVNRLGGGRPEKQQLAYFIR